MRRPIPFVSFGPSHFGSLRRVIEYRELGRAISFGGQPSRGPVLMSVGKATYIEAILGNAKSTALSIELTTQLAGSTW